LQLQLVLLASWCKIVLGSPGEEKRVRLSAFAAAFLLPFAVAALPLLSIFVNFGSTAESEGELVIQDVPIAPVVEEQASAPLAYGTHDAGSSLDCAEASIVAIEG
jgi:hypothetical protein